MNWYWHAFFHHGYRPAQSVSPDDCPLMPCIVNSSFLSRRETRIGANIGANLSLPIPASLPSFISSCPPPTSASTLPGQAGTARIGNRCGVLPHLVVALPVYPKGMELMSSTLELIWSWRVYKCIYMSKGREGEQGREEVGGDKTMGWEQLRPHAFF